MGTEAEIRTNDMEFSEELLISFAKFLAPEIREFYQSDEGKKYFEEWLSEHPEYA